MPSSSYEERILALRGELQGFLRRHAGAMILRHEEIDDLTQGVLARVLAAPPSELRGEDDTRAWLFRHARHHLADRARYWLALKRRSGRVLRFELSRSRASDMALPFEPRASQTSPSQFAIRREQLMTAVKAMDLLLERDRRLLTMAAHEMPLAEQAKALGLSYQATAQASRRAQQRFRDVFRLVVEGGLAG